MEIRNKVFVSTEGFSNILYIFTREQPYSRERHETDIPFSFIFLRISLPICTFMLAQKCSLARNCHFIFPHYIKSGATLLSHSSCKSRLSHCPHKQNEQHAEAHAICRTLTTFAIKAFPTYFIELYRCLVLACELNLRDSDLPAQSVL